MSILCRFTGYFDLHKHEILFRFLVVRGTCVIVVERDSGISPPSQGRRWRGMAMYGKE